MEEKSSKTRAQNAGKSDNNTTKMESANKSKCVARENTFVIRRREATETAPTKERTRKEEQGASNTECRQKLSLSKTKASFEDNQISKPTIKNNAKTTKTTEHKRIHTTTTKFDISTNSTRSNGQNERDEKSKVPTTMGTKGHVKNMVQKLNGSLNSGNDGAVLKKPLNNHTSTCETTQCEDKLIKSGATKQNNSTVKRGIETKIPNIVGVETLYALLCNKHLALQKTYHQLQKQLAKEQEKRKAIEEKLQSAQACEGNNVKQSEANVKKLQQRESELVTKIGELQEQNELLEFRLLELEYVNQQPTLNFKSDKRIGSEECSERDDISDSGVISLSPCEDFFNECDSQDFKTTADEKSTTIINEDEMIEKLSKICHYLDSAVDKIVLQRAIQLIRQYETRICSLETTLTHMCQERIQNDQEEDYFKESKYSSLDDFNKGAIVSGNNKTPKVIATISPFTDRQTTRCYSPESEDATSFKKLLQDVDCLQESGIFDEFDYHHERKCQSTQTDVAETDSEAYIPNLSTELSKLYEIKQRLEERGDRQSVLLKSLASSAYDDNHGQKQHCYRSSEDLKKHFAFYKEQYEILCDKLAVYEASEDEKTRQLSRRLQREMELSQRLKRCEANMKTLKEDKCRLQEEKCEFEEAENDARLRCQKLEVKLYALMEKKNDLQFQLQQSCRTISNLKSTVDELEKKLSESHYRAEKAYTLVNEYEERNFELEEQEIEARYRLHILESAIPAIILWNIFRMMHRLYHLTHYQHRGLRYYSDDNYATSSLSQMTSTFETDIDDGTIEDETFRPKCGDQQQVDGHEVVYCGELDCAKDTRIKELEIKEKVYDQTLQQADEMIATMEYEYKEKLSELEALLNEKTTKLEQCERKLKKISYERNRENLLIDKLQGMEIEVASLKQNIRLKDEEKLSCLTKEKHLKEEIENLNVVITQCKQTEEGMKNKLEIERNMIKQQKTELEFKQVEIKDMEQHNSSQMKQLQNQILKLTRDIENHEVTNSELREEVDTLESVIGELKQSLNYEKDEKEKIQIELSQELAIKQKEIDELSRYSQDILASNTAEEISVARSNTEFNKKKDDPKCYCNPSVASVVSDNISQLQENLQEDVPANRDQTDTVSVSYEPQVNLSTKVPQKDVQVSKDKSCIAQYSVNCNLNKPVFKRLMKSELAFNWNNSSLDSPSSIIQPWLIQQK